MTSPTTEGSEVERRVMRIREHRGLLADSLETTELIEPTMKALTEHIKANLAMWGVSVVEEMVKIEKYGTGIDERCGWDTYIVTVDGWGVFGMTDGPLDA